MIFIFFLGRVSPLLLFGGVSSLQNFYLLRKLNLCIAHIYIGAGL